MRRGDEAFALNSSEDLEAAMAEYRLAIRQGSTDARVLMRLAHTYAAMGRVDDARDSYLLAVEEDESVRDQAVADLVHLAVISFERSDRFGMASAVQAAMEFQPGISVPELALPLAQHYARNGEYGRSIPFFQKAIVDTAGRSDAGVLFELAEAYEEVGDCGRAILFFQQYREEEPRRRRSEVDWHLGECSFRLAQDLRTRGAEEEALGHLELLLEVREPRSLLPRGYFEMGEILSELGRCEEAVEAYRRVLELDPAGTGPLVDRASRRIDDIRFGRSLRRFSQSGRCM